MRMAFIILRDEKKRFLKIFGNRVGLDECEQILQKVYAETDSEFACVGTDDHLRVYHDRGNTCGQSGRAVGKNDFT